MSEKKPIEFNVFGVTQPLPMRSDNSRTKDTIMLESTILFAKYGYGAVSIRDIANCIQMKPSSLYNYFSGKEALFDAVLNHAEDLYLLYFRHLDDTMSRAQTFSEVLDALFQEPIKMSNDFTCYAFSLIMTEQFRDPHCGKIFNETFLDYSINFIKNWMDRCIENGLAFPFDTRTIATLVMHTTLLCINLRVQEFMEHRPPISFEEHFTNLKNLIMYTAGFQNTTDPLPTRPIPGTPSNSSNYPGSWNSGMLKGAAVLAGSERPKNPLAEYSQAPPEPPPASPPKTSTKKRRKKNPPDTPA
ncbi:MAG: TetR/AcrR family transcriptional regulator [Deltaproteobacteria bacterium]|jgi:AcrR family transcriptional regulator|nr:TetR/AcrR family transcriptional regulator [Deltaproteobacteria bacterium]